MKLFPIITILLVILTFYNLFTVIELISIKYVVPRESVLNIDRFIPPHFLRFERFQQNVLKNWVGRIKGRR